MAFSRWFSLVFSLFFHPWKLVFDGRTRGGMNCRMNIVSLWRWMDSGNHERCPWPRRLVRGIMEEILHQLVRAGHMPNPRIMPLFTVFHSGYTIIYYHDTSIMPQLYPHYTIHCTSIIFVSSIILCIIPSIVPSIVPPLYHPSILYVYIYIYHYISYNTINYHTISPFLSPEFTPMPLQLPPIFRTVTILSTCGPWLAPTAPPRCAWILAPPPSRTARRARRGRRRCGRPGRRRKPGEKRKRYAKNGLVLHQDLGISRNMVDFFGKNMRMSATWWIY